MPITQAQNRQLSLAKAELIEAIIKMTWELKAFREIIDQVTVENIPVLRDQSAKLQKCCNEIHITNANLIVNLTTAEK